MTALQKPRSAGVDHKIWLVQRDSTLRNVMFKISLPKLVALFIFLWKDAELHSKTYNSM